MAALAQAGRAFQGLEALLAEGGPEGFSLDSPMWRRAGWGVLDELRSKLENLKELRDLVRE